MKELQGKIMKTELTIISDDLNHDIINEKQARNLLLNLLGISSNSLPVKIERIIVAVAQRWGKDYSGSSVGILGRDAIEICKQYSIDWENYH